MTGPMLAAAANGLATVGLVYVATSLGTVVEVSVEEYAHRWAEHSRSYLTRPQADAVAARIRRAMDPKAQVAEIAPPPVCAACEDDTHDSDYRRCSLCHDCGGPDCECGAPATVTVYVVEEPGDKIARRKYECEACAAIAGDELIARSY